MKHRNPLKPLNGFDLGKEDICEVIFSHEKTVRAAKIFIRWLETNGGEATRAEVSTFARKLADGHIHEGFRYRRESFYRTLLKRLMDLSLISLESRFDAKSKRKVRYVYAPVHQPIPKRRPLGGPSFWRKAWDFCHSWNKEFS